MPNIFPEPKNILNFLILLRMLITNVGMTYFVSCFSKSVLASQIKNKSTSFFFFLRLQVRRVEVKKKKKIVNMQH